MSKWGKVGVALAVALTALTGCSAQGSTGTYSESGEVVDPAPDNNVYVQDSMLKENTYTLRDGRTVTCLALLGPRQGGLSCDWDNAGQ